MPLPRLSVHLQGEAATKNRDAACSLVIFRQLIVHEMIREEAFQVY